MKTKLLLSLTVLVMIAVIVIGAAGYVYAHPNVYSIEERRQLRG
jgi:hypothetical protein